MKFTCLVQSISGVFNAPIRLAQNADDSLKILRRVFLFYAYIVARL